MGMLTTLVFATPIFGLSLTVPPALMNQGAMTDGALGLVDTTMGLTLQVDDAAAAGESAVPSPEELAGAEVGESEADEDGADEDGALSPEEIGELMAQRGRMAPIHRALGIATWSAMAATTAFGFIQYYNLYGWFAGRDDNPCVQGTAILGQSQCVGTPWLHRGSAILTTALYSVTYGLSFRMPDPMNLADGDSDYATNLRTHKWLHWVHLGGMVTQVLLGLFVANSARFGINRADDYGTLQALATAHLGVGLLTFGALTWAAVIQL